MVCDSVQIYQITRALHQIKENRYELGANKFMQNFLQSEIDIKPKVTTLLEPGAGFKQSQVDDAHMDSDMEEDPLAAPGDEDEQLIKAF